MKTRRIASAVLIAVLSQTVSLPAAFAQEDAVTLQARQRFKEGVEAFDKGKYEEARLQFLQAYTLKKHPAVLLNLAQSSAKANHPVEAAKYFQQFLKEATTATPAQRKDAETGLAEVRQKIGRIEVVAPAGTEISLDDQGKVGTTPMDPIDVEVGPHTVKSSTQSVAVTAVAGQKVEAKLGAPAAAAPPVVPVAPDATAASAEPAAPQAADKGSSRAKHTNLLSPPENMLPVYVGLAAGGIGLVSAIVFAAFKSDAQSKADTVANDIRSAAKARNIPTTGACSVSSTGQPAVPEFANACQTLRDNNSKVDTDATVANISLAVMGAGLVFAGVWYLAAPKREDEGKADTKAGLSRTPRRPQRAMVTPYGGWGSGGLSIAGEF